MRKQLMMKKSPVTVYITYFGDDHYWDIEKLTPQKFAVYDRWGEYGQLHMSREYMELTPLK